MRKPIIYTEPLPPPINSISGDVEWKAALEKLIEKTFNEERINKVASKPDVELKNPDTWSNRSIDTRRRAMLHTVNTTRKRALKKREISGAKILSAPPESSRRVEDDYALEVPFSYPVERVQANIAVIAHIYDPEVMHDVRTLLDHIPGFSKLYISTCSNARKDLIEVILQRYVPLNFEIRVIENRGRDIASKTSVFMDAIDDYDFILFLHSKQSRHSDLLKYWRHYLYESLAGSEEIVSSIINIFNTDGTIGIIAPQHFEPMRQWVNWGGNFSMAHRLMSQLKIDIRSDMPSDFPSGSMFWARPAALRALKSLNIETRDFPLENGVKDGTLAHSIERLFFYLCEASGYKWVKVVNPEFCLDTPSTLPVISRASLVESLKTADYRLLSNDNCKKIRPPLVKHITQPSKKFLSTLSKNLRPHNENESINPHIKLAIGIVTFNNSEEQLARCIQAIEIATQQSKLIRDHAISVLHNGIPINTPTNHFVTHINADVNRGFGYAHNVLMKNAFDTGADVYLMLNPDGAIHPDALDPLLNMAYAERTPALVEALQFPCEHPKVYDEYTFNTEWVSGACLLMAREIYTTTGGFDENIFMYCEDVDLSWRARSAGFKTKTCPQSLFLHEVSNRPNSKETLLHILTSVHYLSLKWKLPDLDTWSQNYAHSNGISLKQHERDVEVEPLHARLIPSTKNLTVFGEKRW